MWTEIQRRYATQGTRKQSVCPVCGHSLTNVVVHRYGDNEKYNWKCGGCGHQWPYPTAEEVIAHMKLMLEYMETQTGVSLGDANSYANNVEKI